MNRRGWIILVVVLAACAVVWWQFGSFLRAHLSGQGSTTRPTWAPPKRPWATPLKDPFLANFYRVTADLYRGAQPDANGMKRLEELGIRTVVNLRRFHSDTDEAAGTKLRLVNINISPFHPEREDIVAFLKVMMDPNALPVYVHCQRGIDRTGVMCAAYRIALCKWTKEQALDEMTNGPFGYDGIFKNVPDFLRKLNVGELKREADKQK